MKRTIFALALGTGLFTMAAIPAAMAKTDQQALYSHVEILHNRSILSFEVEAADRDSDSPVRSPQRVIALPPDTGAVDASILQGPAGAVVHAQLLPGTLRGLRLATLELTGATGSVQISVEHDGDWDAALTDRLRRYSRGFDSAMGATLPDRYSEGMNGSYVVISAPEYSAAVQPLVDWKRRKGFNVVHVTTATTGSLGENIRNWLIDAYESWAIPPEYVVLVGDVDKIPAWNFSGNVSDHQYTLMGDMETDWLPDLMLGRMSVEGTFEAETVVNKSVAYEREPYVDDTGWFNRSLMVGGNYGSDTPSTTVTFCGRQLQTIGWNQAAHVFFPPTFNGVPQILSRMNEGVSMVAYRGWAYGTNGWEPPHFTVDEIPSVNNAGMLPVVMSFVCLNNNFAHSSPCFGEVWLRQGTPTDTKGAVAFIGNGEHWSHTRFNDAMAIAFFERIVDPRITDLGSLLVAGKLRFMDYFPHQLEETGDEESVQFYTHIYNLLGDPELNFTKGVPTSLTVLHPATLAAGSNFFDVSVTDDASGDALAGARVGVVQGDELLAVAFTDVLGQAHLSFDPIDASGDLEITVTHSTRIPYEGELATDDDGAFLAVSGFALTDGGDNIANPGETLQLLLSLHNHGGAAATGVSGTLTAPVGAIVNQGSASFPNLPAGGNATAAGTVTATLDPNLLDGQRLLFGVESTHDGSQADLTDLAIAVSAPELMPVSITVSGDGNADPGDAVDLIVRLRNAGSAGTTGLTATLVLDDAGQGAVTDAAGSYGAIAIGAEAANSGNPFSITVADDVLPGSSLSLRLEITSAEGYVQTVPLVLAAGETTLGVPVGPDSYGYYAYDSADLFYTERPLYEWEDISPLYGGTGNLIEYPIDNWLPKLNLPFSFTYYGQDFSTLRVSDNGWVSFDPDSVLDFYNWGLPNAHGLHSIVAPFWDNFSPLVDGGVPTDALKDGIYTKYDASEGLFRIEWSRVRHYREEIKDLQTFQAVLFDPAVHPTASGDGEILFLYRHIANNDYLRGYATVGMEDPSETDGIQIAYSGLYAAGAAPLISGLAIKLSTQPPVLAPFVLDGFSARVAEEGVELSWETRDERPVIGWRLIRVHGEGETEIAVLPAQARSAVDEDAGPGEEVGYRLVALHPYDQESEFGPFLAEQAGQGALRLGLSQNLPNPMRETARIAYVMPAAGQLSLKVYDPAGRLVRTLLDGPMSAGASSVIWDGRNEAGKHAATGVYFYRLNVGGEEISRKLMLIR